MPVLSRQQSRMVIEGNPLDSHNMKGQQQNGHNAIRRGSLAGAVPISVHQLDEVYHRLLDIE